MSQAHLPIQSEPLTVAESLTPAGFWVRVLATLFDGVILSPLVVGTYFAVFSVKSLALVVLLYVPSLIYKPLMECFYGATLGKMACGLRVINQYGSRLTLGAAFVRYLPWLAQIAVSLGSTAWAFSNPQFQEVSGIQELAKLMQRSPYDYFSTILGWVLLIDCVTAAFTERKRAVHDMMAGSYCVRMG